MSTAAGVAAIVTLAAATACSARAQGSEAKAAPAGADATLHAAHWIAAPGTPERDWNVQQFRKVWTAPATLPSHLRIWVSADARFQLRVNGQRVGAGPSYGDLHHWRYEVLDLGPALRPGRNVITATVWRFGSAGPVAQMGVSTAFLLHAEEAQYAALDTEENGGWEVRRDPGRTEAQSAFGGYHAAGPGERMDGRAMLWDADAGSGDAPARAGDGWVKPVSRGPAALREAQDSANDWMLMADPIPAMTYEPTEVGQVVRVTEDEPAGASGTKIVERPDLLAKPLEIPAHRHVVLLLDRRVLTTAYPSFTVGGGRDAELKVTYAEALYDGKGEKGDRNSIAGRHIAGETDEIISDGAPERVYQPLWWRTWRYLQMEVTTGAEPLRLQGVAAFESRYPFTAKGRFQSSDPELAKIWDVGWRTAQLCAHETYTDTPYWEQLQYVGDTRIQSLISYVVTGDDRLARQALAAYYDSRLAEGLTQSRYPSALTQVIPPFSLLWVSMLRDFYQYRGDAAFTRSLLPGTRGVLAWFAAHQREDGLLGPIPWWPFVDWTEEFPGGVPPGAKEGGSSLLTLQYLEALGNAAALERELGDRTEAERYGVQAARLRAALLARSWDAKAGLMADTPEHTHFSQQTNALAVTLDVIPKAQQAGVMRKVLTVMPGQHETKAGAPAMSDASYYFRFYVTQAMVHAGLGDEYVPQLQPWRTMLGLHLSTWAETPEPTRSDSHAWSAHPTYDLETIVAGIRPGSPGFRTVEVEPHLGTLTEAEAAMPTPRGEVSAAYRKSGTGWSATVRLPEGVTGRLLWKGVARPLHGGEQTVALP